MIMNYYELLKKYNRLEERNNYNIEISKYRIKKLQERLKKKGKRLREAKEKDFFYLRWKKESEETNKLFFQKWIFQRIITKIKENPIILTFSRELFDQLKKKAINEFLEKFGSYDTTWKIDLKW